MDIPNVDAIIFYEPVPSEIRLIQRRGRTGRNAPGRCYILLTEDTVDIPFYIVACRKENAMNCILQAPEDLILNKSVDRKRIEFSDNKKKYSELDQIKRYKERRDREKELLANRSIEEIITELDKYSRSQEYKKLKDFGVSFYSDIVKIDQSKLKNRIIKIKGKKDMKPKRKQPYLNRNLKTLVDIVKTYSEDNKIRFSRFQDLAEEEEITERKFYTHFYQACNLGYLKRQAEQVFFIKDYD